MDSAPVPGRIGVITVLYRSERVLPEFLACVAAQTHRDYIAISVDNTSGDRSATLCRDHGFRVIENDDNRGVAAANNQGITAALEAGCEANFVVFDPEAEFVVTAERLHTRHAISPYVGETLNGIVEATYLRGEAVYREGEFTSGARGRELRLC